MPKRWLVKKRLLLVLEATTYTRIYGQQQFGKCVKYFRMFSVYENIFTTKIKQITVITCRILASSACYSHKL